MKKEILDEVIRKHADWLINSVNGERANLSSANLSSADLSYADLSYADLCSANLCSADLSSANLSSANLSFANLSFANLSYANLCSADLSSANLCSADLSFANLSWVIGNSLNLKYIQSGKHEIIYSDKVMAIGCEQHDIKDWWKFDDKTISKMDCGAIEWWKVWKPILKKIIKVSPAKPTGYAEPETETK